MKKEERSMKQEESPAFVKGTIEVVGTFETRVELIRALEK